MSNRTAFLDMIAHSEGTSIIPTSDNGYNVLVGSTINRPILFHDYSRHPNVYNAEMNSTAAGRYQLLNRYYEPYRSQLGLPDFSPTSQDLIALQQIRESHALPDIDVGNLETAISFCSHIWASLPNSGYGQHENKLADLKVIYLKSGGTLSGV